MRDEAIVKCAIVNGMSSREANSLDPWCRTHRRSASCCLTYLQEQLDEAVALLRDWVRDSEALGVMVMIDAKKFLKRIDAKEKL